MGKIVRIDLSNYEVSSVQHTPGFRNSGKALAASLIMGNVPASAEYLSEENCIALVPGLLTGTQAPSTGRITIAAQKSNGSGIKSINAAGPFSQKLASMGIDAALICGTSEKRNAVIHIRDGEVAIHAIDGIRNMKVSEAIGLLRERWGDDTSIIGVGPAGERVIPLASIFSTYSRGKPEYYCSRGGMGDIFGYKGIKAIAVTSGKHFSAEVKDEEAFRAASKRLGKLIVSNPVCGGALPAYGSITLIQMMKQGKKFINAPVQKANGIKLCSGTKATGEKLNKNCAPNCVIGCLNRHSDGKAAYSSPAESEAIAACRHLFNIENNEFVTKLNKRCFESGIDTMEFLFSSAMLLCATDTAVSEQQLEAYVGDLENMTTIGRVLGSGTSNIRALFAENRELEGMVTRPSFMEESRFNVSVPYKAAGCEDISDLEYLYAYMSASGNLGLCLFSSFALLEAENGMDILAELATAKCGVPATPEQLIRGAMEGLYEQKLWEENAHTVNISSFIPEFVKVLYRYFGTEAV